MKNRKQIEKDKSIETMVKELYSKNRNPDKLKSIEEKSMDKLMKNFFKKEYNVDMVEEKNTGKITFKQRLKQVEDRRRSLNEKDSTREVKEIKNKELVK